MNRVLMMDDQYWSICWICSQYIARFVISITENPRVLISAPLEQGFIMRIIEKPLCELRIEQKITKSIIYVKNQLLQINY